MNAIAPRSIVHVRQPTVSAPSSSAKPGYTRIAPGRPATLAVPKSATPQEVVVLTVRFPEGRTSYSGLVHASVDGQHIGTFGTYPPAKPGSERSFVALLRDADPVREAAIQRKLQAGTLKVTLSTQMPGVDVKVRPFD